MADELILPLLGYNDDEEDDTTDSDEGVNNNGDDYDESDTNDSQQIVYDASIPSQHQYLGTDLNDLSGRIVYDECSYAIIPLLTLPGIVLVPGQILPLKLEHPHIVAMMRRIIDDEHTFGITSSSLPTHGTTAEIRSFGEENDYQGEGLAVLRVKAQGRQRFTVRDTWRQTDGILMGKVKILPDIELSNPLRIPTHSHIRRTLAACSRWPNWVYQMYDAEELMKKIKSHLSIWCSVSHNLAPLKPCEFSYWVAANLPLDDSQRCQLLTIDCTIQRLRWELSLLQKYMHLICSDCKVKICNRNDIFSMSVEGPQGNYVNPVGVVHETMTVSKVSSIVLVGRPSTEFSWFPGYAWTICRCSNCRNHMGWKFTSTNKRLKPESFWGLCRSSLEPGLKLDDDAWKPVI